ncbi:T9SS type A sorting domain-containing protein [Lutibacter holmesii]|uniref:T9SS type A sorting domain-containing protein n=1 Tax=Lutibacter holmesii TaxID=1137985 RepID=A0ABW3WNH1_9FLAO
MTIIKNLINGLGLVHTTLIAVLLLTSTVTLAQDSPYQAIRLNNGDPIINEDSFSSATKTDGENINGPSLIRIPDWIPTSERADPTAKYYLYFAHHDGEYIRMAWAANIGGPYTLYDDYAISGNRGVLDNNQSDIFLDNDITIGFNHLASPDVHVDHENKRIIMYFHSGKTTYIGSEDKGNTQLSWVSTSPYGLEFYDNIESVFFGVSYFRVFEHGGYMYALDNGANYNRALDAENPWYTDPTTYDYTKTLWDKKSGVFQSAIDAVTGLDSDEIRARHTGVRVVGDDLHVFYSQRGDIQERIQLSIIDLTDDWTDWTPNYPPYEILAPNPGWEDGELNLDFSESSSGSDINQLRDPYFFEDIDGKLYVVYSGSGEKGLGIAWLYETPITNIALTATEATYIKQGKTNASTFYNLSNLTTNAGSTDDRTIYMKFDLSKVTNIEHAIVRLYLKTTTSLTGNTGLTGIDRTVKGGPVTVYETGNDWAQDEIHAGNAPVLGDAITTTHLTETGKYYEWNITEYAQANISQEISVAFDIAPTNLDIEHKFGSLSENINPPELIMVAESATLPTTAAVWTGSTNNDWTNDSNWLGGVSPGLSPTTNISIPAGLTNYPVLTTGQNLLIASDKHFGIEDGSSLTINNTASFTNNGTLTNNGTISLVSNSTQYPSLIPTSISGWGTITYNRHVNNTTTEAYGRGNDLISAPLSGQAFNEFAAANTNIAIVSGDLVRFGPYKNSNPTSYESWDKTTNTTALTAGVGYRTGSTDNGSFTFTGTVHTEDVLVGITSPAGGKKWNLIGNPYPSYLKIDDGENGFLSNTANEDLLEDETVAIYGYNATDDGGIWTIYNLNTTELLAPGQGFIVASKTEAGGNIQFTPEMRSTGTSDDIIQGKSTSTNANLKLQITSDSKIYKTDFYFNSNSTLGLDPGYDAAVYGSKAPKFAIYSHLVNDNVGSDMGIQSFSNKSISDVIIPLGINATAGEEVTVGISKSTLPEDVLVYLEDTTTDKVVLLNTESYVFTATEDLTTTGRFFLTLKPYEISEIDAEIAVAEKLEIYTAATSKTIHVKGELTGVTTLNLYDIQGRKVLSQKIDQSKISNEIDVSKFNTGIYIVQLKSNTIYKTQKVIIR